MSILQGVILGIVQGLTEFIPISSTAHLIFASRAIGLYDQVNETLRAEQTTATIAVVQLGTLIAVLIYFAPDLWTITYAFIRDHFALLQGGKRPAEMRAADGSISRRRATISDDARLGWLIFIGSLPVAVVGLLFKKQIEGTFTKNLWVIATMMVVIALLLIVAELVGKRRRTMRDLDVRDALTVGGAQVLALIPGASRSGSTIMGGLFAGETRETAARFSFLLSIPAIAASGFLELKEAITKLPQGSMLPLAVATIISGIVGYASIWFLLRYLRTHSMGIFIGYRLIVGIALLLLLATGVVQPLDVNPHRPGAPKAATARISSANYLAPAHAHSQ